MIEETKKELPSLFSYLWNLVRNPVQEIQKLPEIHWKTLVIFQFCLSLVSFCNLVDQCFNFSCDCSFGDRLGVFVFLLFLFDSL